LPPPVDLPPLPLYRFWHQRYQDDRAHAWPRGLARETIRSAPAGRADALA
jgi:hypothetical protein